MDAGPWNDRTAPERDPGFDEPIRFAKPELRRTEIVVQPPGELRPIMTITIELRPDEERVLRERAQTSGRGAAGVRAARPRRAHSLCPSPRGSSKTFDQILAPIREGWQQSGMAEEEITALFEETRDEVRKNDGPARRHREPGRASRSRLRHDDPLSGDGQPTGPAAELLRQLEAGRFILYVSYEILDEARDVLSRPKLRAKSPRVTDETVQETFDPWAGSPKHFLPCRASFRCLATRTTSHISISPSPRMRIIS